MTRHPARGVVVARLAAVALTTVAFTMLLAGPARPAAATPAQAPPPADSPCATPTAGGEVDTVLPDDSWGRFPSSHYDIGCDEGAWNHLSRMVYCTFTDLAFQGSRSATALTLWLIEWSYGFGVYDRLGGHAITIAETYQRNLIGPLRLSELVWFAAVAWASAGHVGTRMRHPAVSQLRDLHRCRPVSGARSHARCVWSPSCRER
jgi:hypothetical protein